MKKFLALLLAVLLCFSFCGCSKLEESIALKRVEKLIIGEWGHIGTEENRNDKTCYEYIYFNGHGGVEKYMGKVFNKNLIAPEYYWKGSYYIYGYGCNEIICLFNEYSDSQGYYSVDTIEEIYSYSIEDGSLKIWKGSEQETNPYYYNKGKWSEQVMLSILR